MPPPVEVTGLQWQTVKLGRKKTVKELVVSFTGALNSGDASDLAAYTLGAAKRRKKVIVYTKPLPLASASYNPASHTVVLVLRGKMPKQGMRVTINADVVRDEAGQSIDGNHDGQPGGNFVATLNARRVLSMARPMAEPRAGRVADAAISAMMADGTSLIEIGKEHRRERGAF